MFEDRKKAKAKAKQKAKVEFEFIGEADNVQDEQTYQNEEQETYDEDHEEKEEEKLDPNKGQVFSHWQIFEGPNKIRDEDAVNLIEKINTQTMCYLLKDF